MEAIKATVRTFLARHVGDRTIGDTEDIFAAGYVNSLFALQLVLFVEQEYGITIGNEDLNLDNFRSVEAIASMVVRKNGEQEPR